MTTGHDIDLDAMQAEQLTAAGVEAEDKGAGGSRREQWLKFTAKGQTLRAALLYFHPVEQVAFGQALREGKTKADLKAAAVAALEARATELGKPVGELSAIDKLATDKAQFKTFSAHYAEGLGYVLSRIGRDGAEADKLWNSLPTPKTYFTTLLLLYPTDRNGTVEREALKERLASKNHTLMPWRFSGKTYDSLWALNDGLRSNNLDLAMQDVIIEATDIQYQNVSVRPAGKAIYRLNENVMRDVLEQAVAKYGILCPFRSMTTDELRAKLHGTGTGNGSAAASYAASSGFEDLLASH